jgi:nitroreductase
LWKNAQRVLINQAKGENNMGMDFLECVNGRRSVRKFKAEQIQDNIITKIITAASSAPSWKNSQTVRYIIVKDEALKNELAETCVMGFKHNHDIIMNAPLLILVTTVMNRSGYERDGSFSTTKGTHWESFDAGIAAQTLCLAAYAEGLGTVIMGIFDEDKTIQTAKIPEDQKLSAMVAIGYPDETPPTPKLKSPDELIDYR